MANKNLVLEVAKWEFNRWFKIKEQIVTIIIGAVISLLIFGSQSLLNKNDERTRLAVINKTEINYSFTDKGSVQYYRKDASELKRLKKSLADKNIDGILVINSLDDAELITEKESGWIDEVKTELSNTRQKIKLKEADITEAELQHIFKSAEIKLSLTGDIKEKSKSGEKFAAGIFNGLMLIGIFLGLAYQFVAITGEKQLRITEVIVSAISPQTWIDGKILGISFLSLAMLLTYSVTTIVFVVISGMFGSGWNIPVTFTDPFILFWLFLFAVAGFFFWNTFFSAIAATINDPNTSARGSLLAVPAIPISIAFFAFGNPDSVVMKILSVFPLTSAPVISVRMVLGEVSIPEILISLTLLVLTTWYVRKAAGKIFELSILMYGKEPSWKEISKWLKKDKNLLQSQ